MSQIKPVITEKSIDNYKKVKVATFAVPLEMNKIEIGKVFVKEWKIKPKAVRTLVRVGKVKRDRTMYKRRFYMTKPKKYALIKIDANDKLDVFEIK